MFSQKIETTEFKNARQIVAWMGAMQAQDYGMAKWAIGLRIKDATEAKIEEWYNKGEIIRTHIMRPTWHFVSPDDVYWMLKLTAEKIISSTKSRHKHLELDSTIINKSNSLIEKKLAKTSCFTREEIAYELNASGIKTDANRLSHLLLCAELEAIICSGPVKDKKLTYSLLPVRVPVKKDLSREEAMAELTRRYFSGHYPATIQDFAWWSNLSLTEIRNAIASVKGEFIIETTPEGQYIYPSSYTGQTTVSKSVHLLPAFDEFLISYKDRSGALSLMKDKTVVSNNGIFYPPIIINGHVAGLWKRTIDKSKVIVTLKTMSKFNKDILKQLEEKSYSFSRFLSKECTISYSNDK